MTHLGAGGPDVRVTNLDDPPARTGPPSAEPVLDQVDPLHAVGRFDYERVVEAVREILIGIGENPERDGLRDTPERVARAYAELFAGTRQQPEDVLATVFDIGHHEFVLVKDIEVWSCCEHHLVPFGGVAHIGYLPNRDGKITGLSKLARPVDVYAKRPQVQERLTTEIADALGRILEPRGVVIVVIECEHLCMTMRGVRKPGSKTITSAVRGQFRNAGVRAEAMRLVLQPHLVCGASAGVVAAAGAGLVSLAPV